MHQEHEISLGSAFGHLVAERKGNVAAQIRAAQRVYAHQSDGTADRLHWLSELLQVIGVRTSVDDCAVVSAEQVERVRQWMLLHETELQAMINLRPSERKEKNATWARVMAERMLNGARHGWR